MIHCGPCDKHIMSVGRDDKLGNDAKSKPSLNINLPFQADFLLFKLFFCNHPVSQVIKYLFLSATLHSLDVAI